MLQKVIDPTYLQLEQDPPISTLRPARTQPVPAQPPGARPARSTRFVPSSFDPPSRLTPVPPPCSLACHQNPTRGPWPPLPLRTYSNIRLIDHLTRHPPFPPPQIRNRSISLVTTPIVASQLQPPHYLYDLSTAALSLFFHTPNSPTLLPSVTFAGVAHQSKSKTTN